MNFYEEIQETSPNLCILCIASLYLMPAKVPDSREIEIALAWIDQLTDDFAPEKYKDTYQQKMEQVIREKSTGRNPKAKPKAPRSAEVKDLMSLLKASLNEEKRGTRRP